MKKLLSVGVIVLFLGLAFAPSINANISKASIDSDLVEITTEVCGLKGGKHTVSLSKEDAEEVKNLIDDIERRLDEVETREEAVEIFNEAIVELDKYGLLGGLSVKQAQRLVAGRYQNSRVVKLLEKLYGENPTTQGDYENRLCLVAGATDLTGSYGFIWHSYLLIELCLLLLIDSIVPDLEDRVIIALLFLLLELTGRAFGTVSNLNPFAIGHTICFGGLVSYIFGEEYDRGANGWVWTLGANGEWKMDGPIWGIMDGPIWEITRDWHLINFVTLHVFPYPEIIVLTLDPGVLGFVGLKITIPYDVMYSFFIGSSISVKLGSHQP